MNNDLEKIRHYQGTITDFKNFFDQKASETTGKPENTNAYDTPAYQGFDNVHSTRGSKESPHWKIEENTGFIPTFENFLNEAVTNVEVNEEKTKPTDDVIRKHINAYSVADDPYEVSVEIGKIYNWTEKEIEKAEKILRKKYLK